MREAKQAELTGKAGEYAVAAQLMIRGIVPAWPAIDRGVDLITDGGCRIQVKSAHLFNSKGTMLYVFPLPRMRRVPGGEGRKARLIPRKSFTECCDFVVFWGIEQNRFWIVSAALADQSTGAELGRDVLQKERFTGSISDMREMEKLGYNRGQIAKHYGMARTSVHRFLDSDKDFADETVVSQMRACEGRWELIADFVPRPAATPAADASLDNQKAEDAT